ncbi:carbohydrate kinase family protein [Frondihabitans cladoniiphilus]|uniref:Carbohydrate kinase n=1 Tax=Frondihabitans cladoniiphilus TaxID=715785 RepID=A0ABP8VJE4_9MICO
MPPADAAPTSPTDPVFVVGEALVDIVDDAEGHHEHPGGSPLNVAYGLARLGVPTTLRTRFGRDARGRSLREHLDRAGVALDPASLTSEPTSTALATVDAEGHAEYEFEIDWTTGEIEAPRDARVVHTGSIATALAPGADDVLRLFEHAAPGTLLTFDPNVRPGVTPDRAAVVARVDRLAGLAHVVKMSDEDAAWLHPGLSLEAVVAHYLDAGAALVAVTRGGDGCLVAAPGVLVSEPSLPVAVVDTIGAGDSFMSGAIFAILSQGLRARMLDRSLSEADVRRIAEVALRSARVTVSRAGANPPSVAELAG